MIVVNHTKRLIMLSTAAGTVALTVGCNTVADEVPMDGASTAMLLESGDISVAGGVPEKGTASVEFDKLKQTEALTVVNNSFDKDQLASFLEQTRNNQVKAAIKARIALIEKSEKDIADEQARKQNGAS